MDRLRARIVLANAIQPPFLARYQLRCSDYRGPDGAGRAMSGSGRRRSLCEKEGILKSKALSGAPGS
jgi:hypothetical protein